MIKEKIIARNINENIEKRAEALIKISKYIYEYLIWNTKPKYTNRLAWWVFVRLRRDKDLFIQYLTKIDTYILTKIVNNFPYFLSKMPIKVKNIASVTRTEIFKILFPLYKG